MMERPRCELGDCPRKAAYAVVCIILKTGMVEKPLRVCNKHIDGLVRE